jgi:hypothetical protein
LTFPQALCEKDNQVRTLELEISTLKDEVRLSNLKVTDLRRDLAHEKRKQATEVGGDGAGMEIELRVRATEVGGDGAGMEIELRVRATEVGGDGAGMEIELRVRGKLLIFVRCSRS